MPDRPTAEEQPPCVTRRPDLTDADRRAIARCLAAALAAARAVQARTAPTPGDDTTPEGQHGR